MRKAQFVRSLGLFVFSAAFIAACGGGGGGSTPADTTPTAFNIGAVDGQALDIDVPSAEVTITGIDSAAPLTISNGVYSINDGEFSATSTTVTNNQRVVVRGRSSTEFESPTTVTLTVGGVEEDFVITTLARDEDPVAFTPEATQTGITVTESYTFAAFPVEGINDDVDISIVDGMFSINNGTFTDVATQVSVDDNVEVQVAASSSFSTTTSATLTIGSRQGVFSVESEVIDTEPGTFELGTASDTNTPSTYAESSVITITEINSPAAISIANGEFKIVGVTEYGATQPTTVSVDQEVQVRVQASAQHGVTETATLTIDTLNDTLAITAVDIAAPTASVVFPTPNTLSDGTTLTLRGTATDDFGPVARVDVTVTPEGGSAADFFQVVTEGGDLQDTWSIQVTLTADTVNTISVTATDSAGLTQSSPVVLTVTQTTTPDSVGFPAGNSSVIFTNANFNGLAWDRTGNRLLLPTPQDRVFAIDLESGTRSVVVNDDPAFGSFSMIYVLAEQEQILFGDQIRNTIYIAALDGSSFLELSNTEDPGPTISSPYGMKIGSDGLLYTVDAVGSFYTVDLASGARTLISDDSRPVGGDNPFTNPTSLILDEDNDRALVAEYTGAQLLWVDMTSGVRTVFVGEDLINPFDIAYDADDDRVIVVDKGLEAILAVRLDNGTVSTLSSDAKPASGSNDLDEPSGMVLDGESDIAFVLSDQGDAGIWSSIKVVDLTSGERVTLTNSVCTEC